MCRWYAQLLLFLQKGRVCRLCRFLFQGVRRQGEELVYLQWAEVRRCFGVWHWPPCTREVFSVLCRRWLYHRAVPCGAPSHTLTCCGCAAIPWQVSGKTDWRLPSSHFSLEESHIQWQCLRVNVNCVPFNHSILFNSINKRGGLEFSWILYGTNHWATAMLIKLQRRGQGTSTLDGKTLKPFHPG